MRFFLPVSEAMVQRTFAALNLSVQVGIMVGLNRINTSMKDTRQQQVGDVSKESSTQIIKPR